MKSQEPCDEHRSSGAYARIATALLAGALTFGLHIHDATAQSATFTLCCDSQTTSCSFQSSCPLPSDNAAEMTIMTATSGSQGGATASIITSPPFHGFCLLNTGGVPGSFPPSWCLDLQPFGTIYEAHQFVDVVLGNTLGNTYNQFETCYLPGICQTIEGDCTNFGSYSCSTGDPPVWWTFLEA